MANGITLEMRALMTRLANRPALPPRETVARDRSLNGKARIRARRQANRRQG
jgi:hypothetical protein